MEDISPSIASALKTLPDMPGVYRYFNAAQKIIYVGKAKNLKKRVLSYFTQPTRHDRKTRALVREIDRIEYTITPTEYEALLLENNLIKQNQPKYNILLRDDKTFPYLCIVKEPFPRLIVTRRRLPASYGEYFGPYASVAAMRSVLEIVRSIFTLRTCGLLLSDKQIAKKKYKRCLEYHVGNCKAPCEGLQTADEYAQDIEQARHILKGDLMRVDQWMRERRQQASTAWAFEQAAWYQEKIELLDHFYAKSLAVNPKLSDMDVVTITSDEHEAFVNYMQIKTGAIVFSTNLYFKKKLQETEEDMLSLAVESIRQTYHSQQPEVLTNIPLPIQSNVYKNIVPAIGDKRKLIEMSLKNALYAKQKRYQEKEKRQARIHPGVAELHTLLNLKQAPLAIECFDNSNIQGANPVAAMVRFANGKPDKKQYRHFNIKTVEGPDDFASMREIVGRRYRRLTDEGEPLPDLIVIDGGKGQLSSACEALKSLNLYGKMPIIGIAKRLEEIYFPEDPIPLHLPKKSTALMLLQQIRDEAHRFAITFHRLKRSQSTFMTALETVSGIGEKNATKLLSHFKSVKKIKEASREALAEVVGDALAQDIKEKWPASTVE